MMEIINKNIRFLREEAGWTQKELASRLEVNQPVIGSYEESRSIPPLPVIIRIGDVFNIDLDTLVKVDLSKASKKKNNVVDKFKRGNEVLAVTVDSNNKENIEFVNQKASAGYTNGYSDTEFIKDLPKIHLPFLSRNGTYRGFEITGDSMLPIPTKSVVVGEYISDISSIKDGEACVVITKEEGIVFKRVYNFLKESNGFLLVSDNPLYKPYFVHFNDVVEVWKKVRIIIDNVEINASLTGGELASFALNIHHELNRKK